MKKAVLICAVVMMMGLARSEAATASQGFHSCKIVYAGSFFGKSTLGLTSSDWTGTVWVSLDPANEKNMLATALTARSLDANVNCWIKGDVEADGNQMLLGIGVLEE